jgi:hypothetical protein
VSTSATQDTVIVFSKGDAFNLLDEGAARGTALPVEELRSPLVSASLNQLPVSTSAS